MSLGRGGSYMVATFIEMSILDVKTAKEHEKQFWISQAYFNSCTPKISRNFGLVVYREFFFAKKNRAKMSTEYKSAART